MIKTYTISTDDGRYKLSALIINNKFQMPSFEEYPCDSNNLKIAYLIADSSSWLLNEFYPIIKECVLSDDYSEFDKWYNSNEHKLDHIYLGELLEMFDEAIKLKFFEDL